MKRFKKLTIYVLVGVLLSSSVMMSYKKAEVVKASATLTLGTGALLMLGILGAYGIVYKGAVDSATGEYIWKGDRGLYPHEVEEAEEWFSNMYDNAVRNWCAQNGKDPDDWNGDDDGDGDDMDEIIEQPPLWETLVGSSVAKSEQMTKTAIKITGALAVVLADVITEFKQETETDNNNPLYYVFPKSVDTRCIEVWNNWKETYPYFAVRGGTLYMYKESKNCVLDGTSYKIVGSTRYRFYRCDYTDGSAPYLSFEYSKSSSEYHYFGTDGFFTNMYYGDSYGNKLEDGYNDILTPSVVGSHTNINSESSPIIPLFYFPSLDKIESLLDNLENSTGDETGTQNAVDTFVDSLGQTETDTEPDTGGNEGTGTNPDTGGQGGTGGDNEENEDEENGMFLADLKNVFPFCIPFDLIDCFRLFNAEPETPRVEVPLHFGIVEKEYTFVIDLKDFDGVAEICRSMFLILYIVGLVMATRPLIRG